MEKNKVSNLIKELVERATISVSDITVSEDDSGTTWFSVEVDNPHLFSGHGGEALFALNHLARRIVESQMASLSNQPDTKATELKILIDINGFQKKRIENIRATAHMMAERARYFKSNIEIDPMSAFERRVVHEFLSGASDLKTESMGEGLSRRVVIKYIGSL
jgi:spoIIIJ-associated protein